MAERVLPDRKSGAGLAAPGAAERSDPSLRHLLLEQRAHPNPVQHGGGQAQAAPAALKKLRPEPDPEGFTEAKVKRRSTRTRLSRNGHPSETRPQLGQVACG